MKVLLFGIAMILAGTNSLILAAAGMDALLFIGIIFTAIGLIVSFVGICTRDDNDQSSDKDQ